MSHPISRFQKTLFWLSLGLLLPLCLISAARYIALTPPLGVTPLGDVDLQQIRGPWFEVARLESPIEESFRFPMLDIRYTGPGADFSFAYPDPSDPRLRIILTGKDSSGQSHILFDQRTQRLDDFKTGTLQISCQRFLPCGFHLINYDQDDRTWMVIAGATHAQLWIFSRGPGILPRTWEKISLELKKNGYNLDHLTVSQALPAIPASNPSVPAIPPPPPTGLR